MSKCNHTENERGGEERIECAVEDIPETNVIAPDLPELGKLVADKAEREEVEDNFHDIKVTRGVDGVNSTGVQSEVNDRYSNLHRVLVHRYSHTVGVQMCPVVSVGLLLVVDEAGGILVILDKPSPPKVRDALLVTGRPNYGNGMEIYGAFYRVGGDCRFIVNEKGVSREEHLSK